MTTSARLSARGLRKWFKRVVKIDTYKEKALAKPARRAHRISYVLFLFSKSAGADFEEGKRLNKKMVLAESLPGKVAPLSAGEIIAETILNAEEI